MDSRFTRKEEECPLAGCYCNREDKDCDICLGEEEEFQTLECLKQLKGEL